MKVQCGHCPAKYAVADERIRDKKVRIRCRRCNAAIVVDGKVSPPLVTSTPARPSVGPLSNAPGPESLPPSNPPPDHRPMAHTIMGGLEAPVTHRLMQDHVGRVASAGLEQNGEDRVLEGMPDASRGFTDPPARGEADRWRVALTQQDLRWMTTEEITQAFQDGAVKSETFVFRAGMPTWVTLLEVSEIAQALADAHLVSPPLQTLHLEEEGSSPEQRISSLPPPRKAARSRGAQPLPELAPDGAESASDSDGLLPFALVPERAGSKQPTDEGPELPAEEPMAPSPSPPLATVAVQPAVGADTPAVSAAAPAGTSGSLEGSAAPVVAPATKSSGAWIWISLVVLIALAGAAFVLGPRFGLHLR